jgi:hypothetical protein
MMSKSLSWNPLCFRLLPLAAILACGATAPVASTCLVSEAPALQKSQADAPVNQLITWLPDEGRQLRGILFAEVILDTTGKRVLPVNPNDEIDQRVIKQSERAGILSRSKALCCREP